MFLCVSISSSGWCWYYGWPLSIFYRGMGILLLDIAYSRLFPSGVVFCLTHDFGSCFSKEKNKKKKKTTEKKWCLTARHRSLHAQLHSWYVWPSLAVCWLLLYLFSLHIAPGHNQSLLWIRTLTVIRTCLTHLGSLLLKRAIPPTRDLEFLAKTNVVLREDRRIRVWRDGREHSRLKWGDVLSTA